MDWFLYDNDLRHERVKWNTRFFYKQQQIEIGKKSSKG